MTPHDEPAEPVTRSRLVAVVADAHRQREDTAALRAEGRQARRQARRLRAAGSAILESAAAITSETLASRRFALAEPVAARFHTDEAGNTGIELTIRLQDPAQAAAATDAIAQRFGGQSACDSVIVS